MNDVEIATNLIATAKENEELVMLTLVDGTTVSGSPISVNSKGVNLRIDDKTRSFGLKRIDAIDLVTDDDEDDSDEETDENIYAMLGDDMTTSELAAMLSDTLKIDLSPKELRVHLRALGLGVGKGRKYSLSASEYRMVKDIVTAPAAN
jgi:hypothetical protein